MLKKRSALKWLAILIAAMMFLSAFITYLFDPFYQYHEPYFGLERVFNNRDYQMVGSVKNLSYDSVLVGSSVAENFDSSFLDKEYDCNTLKIIRATGSAADLLHYLEIAHGKQDLKNVFWCMDIFALTGSTEVTVASDKALKYLHTDTILDDATYLFNKDVLFKEIPLYVAYSVMGINTGGQAYDWSADKEFSAARAMQVYEKPDEVLAEQPHDEQLALLEQNLSNVLQEINGHPETEYIIMFPPYSMLWWDCGYVNGTGELYLKVLEEALPALTACDNVKLYFFQSERDIICNLDNYMDMLHYSPAINQYMLDKVVEDLNRVTEENVESVLLEMRETYEYIIEEGIYQYYMK